MLIICCFPPVRTSVLQVQASGLYMGTHLTSNSWIGVNYFCNTTTQSFQSTPSDNFPHKCVCVLCFSVGFSNGLHKATFKALAQTLIKLRRCTWKKSSQDVHIRTRRGVICHPPFTVVQISHRSWLLTGKWNQWSLKRPYMAQLLNKGRNFLHSGSHGYTDDLSLASHCCHVDHLVEFAVHYIVEDGKIRF